MHTPLFRDKKNTKTVTARNLKNKEFVGFKDSGDISKCPMDQKIITFGK